MDTIMHLVKTEPVLVRTALMAFVALAVGFGLNVTDTQIDHIEYAVVAVMALIAASARQRVTPVD